MNTPVLSVRNLSTWLQIAHRDYAVVDNFSFDLYKGKTLAIVGESGCGKTMTALSIMRILPFSPKHFTSGVVEYGNKNLLESSEKEMRKIRGAGLAMIFQDPSNSLNPLYTIGRQLAESVEIHHGVYGDKAKDMVLQSLMEVGIPFPSERFDDYPHQMSGGMKQRILIAMALIGNPEVLIADEPTTALDVTIQLQVLELIKSLQRKRGMAMLLITHDLGVVAEMADEVIVMYASQEVERGKSGSIFDAPAHPYTQGLFASRINLAGPRAKLFPIRGQVPPLTSYPKGCRFHPRCPFVMEKCLHGSIPHFNVEEGHRARCVLCDKERIDDAR